jgi:hypothetical protein
VQSSAEKRYSKTMAIIKAGDLVVGKATGNKYIAVSDDFIKRVPGTGEFLDDYSYVRAVRVVNPRTGAESVEYLSSLRKV